MNRTVPTLSCLLLIVELAGITCQFLQTTDPTPPLTYFTIDSAALTALAAAWTLARPPIDRTARLRGIGAVGVVASGIIYATVIAPATPTGTWVQPTDDTAVRIATILLHGAAPPLAAALFLLASPPPYRRAAAEATRWLAFPATYLAIISLGAVAGAWTIPYPFLRPSRSGWPLVLLAVAALSALIMLIGLVLLTVSARLHRTANRLHTKADSRLS